MDQVARNKELLNTARDCFHFVVEFFEPINASATHIYHSALKLSPLSSIVRRLYYHHQHTPLPRVLVGIWDSWDQGIAIGSTCKGYGYHPYTWSPCGQFVATYIGRRRIRDSLEIRDGVTLQLLSTLTTPDGHSPASHSDISLTTPGIYLIGGPSYSPDGSFLASLTNTSLIIWDIQTGGVIKEIGYNSNEKAQDVSLVWSLDGETICAVSYEKFIIGTVHTYDITSGTTLFSITIPLRHNPHLWAHNTSFRVLTTWWDGLSHTINIFEVGSTLTKIESFRINLWSSIDDPYYEIDSFSPTTYRISIRDDTSSTILDVRRSEYLLEEDRLLQSGCFSFDGSYYAAYCAFNYIQIWKYTSGHYTLWKELPFQGSNSSTSHPPCFSPTLSSILSCSRDTSSLWIWQLDDPPPTTPSSDHMLSVPPHCCDTYMVTSYVGNSTVTITDLLSQTPCHFIDTGMEIEALVLTGNILLVMDSTTIAAWKLTEEGVAVGAVGQKRASFHDCIWTAIQPYNPKIAVEDQIAFIQGGQGTTLYLYSTETGEELDLTQATPPQDWYFCSPDDIYLRGFSECTEHSWVSIWGEIIPGWIKDPDGKYQLWIPVKWRSPDHENTCWLHHVKTLRLIIDREPIVIKF
jgi:hypothetical protein